MSKPKSSIKFFKNISNSINSLLEKNLNRLKFDNLIKIAKSNKIFLSIVALVILSLSYLSIPNIYNSSEISEELKKDIFKKLNLKINLSQRLDYKFFPRPHFTSKDSSIIFNQKKILETKNIKIYVSLENLFSLKNMKITKIIIEDANFNLNVNNHDFFTKFLDNNFVENNVIIKNSNIFFRNINNEVLFINKILRGSYFYDSKELKNIFYSENEIFNLPYSLEIFNDKNEKKLYSKLNIDLLKLQIKNDHFYNNRIKTGSSEVIFNKIKSIFKYKLGENNLEFNYFDKKDEPNFLYKGNLNFKPFYSSINGISEDFNLSHLLSNNGIFSQILKTELLNNKNIDFKLDLKADRVQYLNNFVNLFLNFKIKEGLIDFDKTFISWKDYANFETLNSLIYVKNGQLVLDGSLKINLISHNKIFQYLLTPKKFRKKIKQIDLNFNYNFDQKVIDIKDIRIDGKLSKDVNRVINNISLKNDALKNKVYLKRLLNEAISNYSG